MIILWGPVKDVCKGSEKNGPDSLRMIITRKGSKGDLGWGMRGVIFLRDS